MVVIRYAFMSRGSGTVIPDFDCVWWPLGLLFLIVEYFSWVPHRSAVRKGVPFKGHTPLPHHAIY